MSRIPKLPAANAKENRPGLFQRAAAGRGLSSALSDADKRNLISAHTRPLLRTAPASAADLKRPAVADLKRPAAAAAPAAASRGLGSAPPPKQAKVERKPAKVAPKIPPYDYKARFADLLEKHRAMKSEFSELSDTHKEMAYEYEQVKSGAGAAAAERDSLAEQLATALADLRDNAEAHVKLLAQLELERRHNEELRRKTEGSEFSEPSDTHKEMAYEYERRGRGGGGARSSRPLERRHNEDREVTEALRTKSSQLERLETEHAELRRSHEILTVETKSLRKRNNELEDTSIKYKMLQLDHEETIKALAAERGQVESLQNMLAGMDKEQRELRNMVQDLKGNIRVYCRVRPALASESGRPLFNLHVLDACSIEVEKVELNSASSSTRKGRQLQAFTFDGIFTPHSSQEDVFTEVSSVVQSALDGYNVCIFAYGQTGSGKTYTMEGGRGEAQYGIIPRAFDMMFNNIRGMEHMGWSVTIKASFLEIYNENIYDLLDGSKDQDSHDIKLVDSKGSDVYVSNLREELIGSSHEFIRLMMQAQRNRQTAATLNNERSSRSHSVTQVRISAVNNMRKEKITSNLNLVDLAGSESGKTTQRMDETKHINRSLSELSKVILSLQTNQAHVPYRNSKLTYLLMPSLGGNSKTLMLVNVSQIEECYGETLNSLRFATKVNSCRTVKAKKNITMVDVS